MNVSIVIPVYRDTDALPELVDKLFQTASTHGYDTNIILVDDGSENDAWKKLLEIKASRTSSRIQLLRLAHNYGQQAATICGLMHCGSEIAVTMDSDLQHPPEMIPIMLEAMIRENLDAIYGIPKKSHHSFLRRAGSLIFRAFTQPLFSSAATSCSFRVIRTSIMHELQEQVWRPSPSLDAFIKSKTRLVRSIKISHAPRRYGSSTYTWKALFTRAAKELYYSGHSGTVYILTGLAAILLGSMDILQMAAINPPKWKSFIIENLHFLAGGFALIFFGRHLSRTGNLRTQYPAFIIAEKIE